MGGDEAWLEVKREIEEEINSLLKPGEVLKRKSIPEALKKFIPEGFKWTAPMINCVILELEDAVKNKKIVWEEFKQALNGAAEESAKEGLTTLILYAIGGTAVAGTAGTILGLAIGGVVSIWSKAAKMIYTEVTKNDPNPANKYGFFAGHC